jgi:3-dehydroquinate dehydratase/shikimate dehydrogenase
LEATPEAVARRLEQAPPASALVELRADHLRAADAAGLVRLAGRPVAATVRSREDGGAFDGSTEEKKSILSAALDAGSAFVDVEWDGPLRDWADGRHAGRIILSHHGAACDGAVLRPLYDAMAGTKAARIKIVPRATRAPELRALRDLLARARASRRELCAFALGTLGTWSRVAALRWGSWATYGAAAAGRETGEGQLTTRELLDVYRVLELGEATRWFGLCGAPLRDSPSPGLHAAGYRASGLDAVYVPIETHEIGEVEAVAGVDGLLPLSGFGVTMPLKTAAAQRCAHLHEFAGCGAVNTVVPGEGGWDGFNTDAPAALALIRKHLEPRGTLAAVVGAGGTARAIAAALKDAGASVTLFNRSTPRGEETADAIGVAFAPLDAISRAAWDLLVQATPLGRHGEEFLLRRHLGGRMVLDAAYGAEPTPLVRAARARGLAVADGFDLMREQAVLQFERLTGRTAPRAAMAAAFQPWRDASDA